MPVPEWIHETKQDGHHPIIIDQGKIRAIFRHGRDGTGPYRRGVEASGKLSCQAAIRGQHTSNDDGGREV
jgi:ATP-dependent DNA ligase